MMAIQLNWYCPTHADAYSCPDALIVFGEQHGYGIRIHDGGDSFLKIDFCPWCGQRLDRG